MSRTEIVPLIVLWFNYLIVLYIGFINIVYTLLLLGSTKEMYIYHKKIKYWSDQEMIDSNYTPPLSILVPCHNEEDTIVDNVKALMNLEYREYEIVIVNDGSTDSTLKVLRENFDFKLSDIPYRRQIETERVKSIYISTIYDNIVLVNKENGGKADALNAGINICKYPLFTAIDADSIIERSSLIKVIRPFIEDPEVIASGGIVRPINDSEVDNGFLQSIRLPKSSLARFQVVEYLRAFLFGRISWSAVNSLLIVSGAFGVFQKRVTISAGGYTKDTIGEDMELVTKIHRIMKERGENYKIVFVPDPVCWTQVPEDMKTLKSQRQRWHKGLIDTVLNHKKMIFNANYGTVGLLGMPYYLLIEIVGVLVEVFGYAFAIISFIYGIVDLEFAIVFLGVSVLYGIFLSLGAVFLEEYNFKKYDKISDYLLLVLYGILENFGYRQIVTVWRFTAFFKYRRNQKVWGDMKRKKFTQS